MASWDTGCSILPPGFQNSPADAGRWMVLHHQVSQPGFRGHRSQLAMTVRCRARFSTRTVVALKGCNRSYTFPDGHPISGSDNRHGLLIRPSHSPNFHEATVREAVDGLKECKRYTTYAEDTSFWESSLHSSDIDVHVHQYYFSFQTSLPPGCRRSTKGALYL